MEFGIFSKTYEERSLDGIFQAMQGHGLHVTQFNLSCAGLETMPDSIEDKVLEEIADCAERYQIHIAALSGTFNMINPDKYGLSEDYRRFDTLCQTARALHIQVITLCTGSRNPKSKWIWHPDNASPASWADLMRSADYVLSCAEKYDLTLAAEPEQSNIVRTAELARKFLDQAGSPRLKIILDGANLFQADRPDETNRILRDSIELLKDDIVLAHAKDFLTGGGTQFVAAGTGCMDYPLYLKLLAASGYDGPLILHGLSEAQVPESLRYLKGLMN